MKIAQMANAIMGTTLIFMMTFLNGEKNFVNHMNCAFDELEVDFCKKVSKGSI
jgi:hypothetical protein